MRPLNFNFALVDHKLLWVNFEQKMVWELDTRQIIDAPSTNLKDNVLNEPDSDDEKRLQV